MSRISYFIIVLVFSFACDRPSHNIHYINDVIVLDTLYGNEMTVLVDMLMPTKVIILDTCLVVFDQAGDNLFHVFDGFSLDHMYSFGKVGRGPDEFTNIDPNTIKALNGDLVFLDNNELVSIRIGSNKAERTKAHVIKLASNPLNRLQVINDSIYIADLMEGENEYSMVNINSGYELKVFGTYPSTGLKVANDMDRYQAFIKAPVSNPSNSKFAVFYLYHNKMRIYNNGNLQSETNVEHSFDKYTPDEKSNNLIFRSEPAATADHIYTLNIEKRKKDIDFSTFRPKIEVWNWEGNLIAKYALNKSIITFGVSEKFKKIYATSVDSPDKIYVFDLPMPLEKKCIDTLLYKQVDNRFYRVDIPDLLSYSTASPEQEKNKVTKHNGLLYNSCYFVSSLDNDDQAIFNGSVGIVVASEYRDSIDDLTLEEFVEHRDKNLKDQLYSYTNTVSTINLNKVVITSTEYEGIDPKGVPFNLKSRKWRWKEQEQFVEVDYSSTENFELYVHNIERVIASFRLKSDKINDL